MMVTTLTPRMKNPASILPNAMTAMQTLTAATFKGGVDPITLGLVHLRASQINGCSVCVAGGATHARKAGETDDRLFAVAAWRDAPYFTEAERAALAEALTRLADRTDPVPDTIWTEAAKHFDEPALGALVLYVGLVNVWNRLNVATRQVAGATPW